MCLVPHRSFFLFFFVLNFRHCCTKLIPGLHLSLFTIPSLLENQHSTENLLFCNSSGGVKKHSSHLQYVRPYQMAWVIITTTSWRCCRSWITPITVSGPISYHLEPRGRIKDLNFGLFSFGDSGNLSQAIENNSQYSVGNHQDICEKRLK